MPPRVDVPDGKLEIVTICIGDPKQTYDFCALCSFYNCHYITIVISGVVLYSQKMSLPDVNHAVVIFDPN